MKDDKKKRSEPDDRSHINLDADFEVRYWCGKLRLAPNELQHMVTEHGGSVEKIRAALGR
jgi:hypothetical protein